VSTVEKLLGRKSNGSSLENRDLGHKGPVTWPRDISLSANVAANFTKRWSLGRSVYFARGLRPWSLLFVCLFVMLVFKYLVVHFQFPLPCGIKTRVSLFQKATSTKNLRSVHWHFVPLQWANRTSRCFIADKCYLIELSGTIIRLTSLCLLKLFLIRLLRYMIKFTCQEWIYKRYCTLKLSYFIWQMWLRNVVYNMCTPRDIQVRVRYLSRWRRPLRYH
jgi:hypothetical protein